MWLGLGIAGALTVLTGWLPATSAQDVAVTRGGPILGFLAAITVLAMLTDKAGVFDAAARACARLARGSTMRLYLLIAVIGAAVTTAMSLDTTAVLLTPVVLSLTRQLGIRAEPFALLAVWLANTASLLLPVSNLTNLLAMERERLSTARFAGAMAAPALVAVLLTVLYLMTIYRRDLRGSYDIPQAAAPPDRWIFGVCLVACMAMIPGVLVGLAPWRVAAVSAFAAVIVFVIRARGELALSLVPWRLIIAVEGLFLIVAALARHGLTELLQHLIGNSSLQAATTSALASNVVNNLPAYLAVESAVPVGHTSQLFGTLLGTNLGPLVLLWGSLATLLWRESCAQRGLVISARRFALVGLGGMPPVLGGAWVALMVAN